MTSRSTTGDQTAARTSWLPMAAIAMGQAQMSWNINALPVSIGGISAEFGTAPSTVVTAIVAYSLGVAGFTMLGARLGQRVGPLRMFRWMTAVFLAAMVVMTTSASPAVMIAAQALAGLASAAIIPSLVVLTAHHYKGKQQATALGVLGAVQAIATVVAFFVAGVVGTYYGWRYSFGLLIPFSIGVLLLSRHLAPVEKVPGVEIDRLGVVLAATAVILLSVGFNYLDDWGVLLAKSAAPFSVYGLSPALVMIVCGVLGVQLFIAWTQRRQATGQTPLLALAVIESTQDRAAVTSMMAMTMLGKAITFMIPLYMQMVQGGTSLQTAVAMIPYQLAVLVAAILVVRLYGRLTPRQIARSAFAVVTFGTLMLAVIVRNDWSNVYVVLGLMLVGSRAGCARHAAVQRPGHVVAEGICRRRRGVARHRQQPGRRGRHGGHGSARRQHPQRQHRARPGRPPDDPDDAHFEGRPRQRQVRQQRPAARHDVAHDGDPRAGRCGHAGQCGRTTARAEADVPAVDGARPAGLRPGGAAARLQA